MVCSAFKEVSFRETHLWHHFGRTGQIALITCLKKVKRIRRLFEAYTALQISQYVSRRMGCSILSVHAQLYLFRFANQILLSWALCNSASNTQLRYGSDNLWVQDALRTRARKQIDFLNQDQLAQLNFENFTPPCALIPTIFDKSADLPNTVWANPNRITQLPQKSGKFAQMAMSRPNDSSDLENHNLLK